MRFIKIFFLLFIVSVVVSGCGISRPCLKWETREVSTGQCPSYMKYCSVSTTVLQQVCVKREGDDQKRATRTKKATSWSDWHQYRVQGTKQLNYSKLSVRKDGHARLFATFGGVIKEDISTRKRIRKLNGNVIEIWEFIPKGSKYGGFNTKIVRKIRKIDANNFEIISHIKYSYFSGNRKFNNSFSVSDSDASHQYKGKSGKRTRCMFKYNTNRAKRKDAYDERTERDVKAFEREIMLARNQANNTSAPRSQSISWLNGTWCKKS